ncbi:predicted protein [Nematostella vectensis]|uniref:Death domain-containing protein n=1 Tax=Nematostella vectensis TaxID=45351 RepID=A7RW73_NEMVE|nr:uncharacterized protein LOC5516174 [Nematostella vectensis]EDO44217.1 predicted protein [Nematostella vectensis]|eukprot:XP_001636280.1 predicted protein [Nematostella vectensis]
MLKALKRRCLRAKIKIKGSNNTSSSVCQITEVQHQQRVFEGMNEVVVDSTKKISRKQQGNITSTCPENTSEVNLASHHSDSKIPTTINICDISTQNSMHPEKKVTESDEPAAVLCQQGQREIPITDQNAMKDISGCVAGLKISTPHQVDKVALDSLKDIDKHMANQNEEELLQREVEGLRLDTCLSENAEIMEKLYLMLDREHRVINNWRHLAYYFKIDANILTSFELCAETSPTVDLFETLNVSHPDLTVKQLKDALRRIHRNDIICLLEKYSENWNVSDLCHKVPEFIEIFKARLDIRSNSIGDWKSFAMQLGLTKKHVDTFGEPKTSPTENLFLYLSGINDTTSISQLRDHLKDMERNDVVRHLNNLNGAQLVKDVITPQSEILLKLSSLLDKESRAVKNWKNLCHRLKIPNSKYESFDASKKNAHSPTKQMLRWLKWKYPGITVGELADGLQHIRRNDVRGDLLKAAKAVLEKRSRPTTPTATETAPLGAYSHGLGRLDPREPHQLPGNWVTGPKTRPTREEKLRMKASDMPVDVYKRVCLMLDVKQPFWDDYRMLGEAMGIDKCGIRILEEKPSSQTDVILYQYSKGMTVKELMELLQTENLKRRDVVEEILCWVESENV